MNNDEYQEKVISQLAKLNEQVAEIKVIHTKMVSDHERRIELLDELIGDQKRNDRWWREGREPPCE